MIYFLASLHLGHIKRLSWRQLMRHLLNVTLAGVITAFEVDCLFHIVNVTIGFVYVTGFHWRNWSLTESFLNIAHYTYLCCRYLSSSVLKLHPGHAVDLGTISCVDDLTILTGTERTVFSRLTLGRLAEVAGSDGDIPWVPWLIFFVFVGFAEDVEVELVGVLILVSDLLKVFPYEFGLLIGNLILFRAFGCLLVNSCSRSSSFSIRHIGIC